MFRYCLSLAAGAALLIAFAAEAGSLTPVDQSRMKVNFLALNGYSEADQEKVRAAAALLERVLNSAEFRQAVLSFTGGGTGVGASGDRPGFVGSKGLTNDQLYQTLMRGRESYAAADDYTLDVSLSLYVPPWHKRHAVIGYTYPESEIIYANQYFFRDFTPGEVAANLAHEWTHKLGFEHAYERTPDRPFSVPYGIGGIVRSLASAAP
jgi:hypothetical protein